MLFFVVCLTLLADYTGVREFIMICFIKTYNECIINWKSYLSWAFILHVSISW